MVKIHKLRNYKIKLLKAKYRNNDWKKKWWTVKKNSRSFLGQNSENSKFQDKFQDIFRFSRTCGHPVKISFQENTCIDIFHSTLLAWTKWPHHFWLHQPKNYWNNFWLSWIYTSCTSMKKISSFHQFILEIQSISESWDQTDHTHFWLNHFKIL